MARSRKVIYVRTTGDDSANLGTLASPYRSVARALRAINQNLGKHAWYIDCTDLGTHDIKDGLEISGFRSAGYINDVAAGDRYAPMLQYECAINIVAIPTVAYTFAEADVTSEVYDPVANNTTITVTDADFTGLADAFLRTAAEYAGVVSVAANVIVVAGYVSITGATTIEIVRPSATLQLTSAGSGNRYIMAIEGGISIHLYGIGFDTNGLAELDIATASPDTRFTGCKFDKDLLAFSTGQIIVQGCRATAPIVVRHHFVDIEDSTFIENSINITTVIRWEDLQLTPDQGNAAASLTYAAYRDTPFKMYFLDQNVDDELFFRFQMPHGWDPTTAIKFHMHVVPMANGAGGADTVRFEGKYCWSVHGSAIPAVASWETIGGATGYVNLVVAADGQYKEVVVPIQTIVPPANTKESAMLLIYVKRAAANVADTFAADVGLLSADIHYQRSKPGTTVEMPS